MIRSNYASAVPNIVKYNIFLYEYFESPFLWLHRMAAPRQAYAYNLLFIISPFNDQSNALLLDDFRIIL